MFFLFVLIFVIYAFYHFRSPSLTEFNLLNEAIKLLFYIVFNIYGLIHIYFKGFSKLLWFWITNIKLFFFGY